MLRIKKTLHGKSHPFFQIVLFYHAAAKINLLCDGACGPRADMIESMQGK